MAAILGTGNQQTVLSGSSVQTGPTAWQGAASRPIAVCANSSRGGGDLDPVLLAAHTAASEEAGAEHSLFGHSNGAECRPPADTLQLSSSRPLTPFFATHLQYKLNTDESPGVALEYGIRSIPTVMLFKDGSKQETIIGAVPKSTLSATIEKFI